MTAGIVRAQRIPWDKVDGQLRIFALDQPRNAVGRISGDLELAASPSTFSLPAEFVTPKIRFALDSPLEEGGFEPSVPPLSEFGLSGGQNARGSGRDTHR